MSADELYAKGIELLSNYSDERATALKDLLSEFKSKLEDASNTILSEKCEFEIRLNRVDAELVKISDLYRKAHADLEESKSNEASKSAELRMSMEKCNEQAKMLQQLQTDKEACRHQLDSLRQEQTHLQSEAENRNSKITFLQSELEFLEQKLRISVKEKSELVEINANLNSAESRLRNSEISWSNDRQILQTQVTSLNEKTSETVQKLIAKEQEITQLKMEKDSKITLLQQDVSRLESERLNLRSSLEDRETRIRGLINEKSQIRADYDDQSKKVEAEIDSLHKSAAELKKDHETLNVQFKQRCLEVSNLQRKLKETEDESTNIEQRKDDEIKLLTSKLSELEATVSRKNDELSDIHDRLIHVDSHKENVSRTASMGVRPNQVPTNSDKCTMHSNSSFIQIYDELNQVRIELANEKKENKKLNESLNIVLEEIKEKAPLLIRQKVRYECAIERNTAMRQSIEALSKQMEIMNADNSMRARRFNAINRENTMLKQENKDLASQVRVLLRQSFLNNGSFNESVDKSITVHSSANDKESLRLNETNNQQSFQTRHTTDSNGSTGSDGVDLKLVTFESIDELQERNQQLLAVVRDLRSSKEHAEEDVIKERTSEMSITVDSLTKRLDAMADKLQTYKSTINALTNQRDAYKKLIESKPIPLSPDESIDDDSKIADSMTSRKRIESLERSMTENRKYLIDQKEIHEVTYRQLKEANESLEQERTDLKVEMADWKSKLAIADAKLSDNSETVRSYSVHIDNCKNEIAQWTNKYNAMAKLQGQLEASNQILNQSIICMTEKNNLLESQKKTFNFDLEMERDKVVQLEKEKAILEESLKCNAQLLTVADTLKETVERSSRENRYMLEVKVASLEKDLKNAVDKCERQEKLKDLVQSSHQIELEEMKQTLEDEKRSHADSRSQLHESQLKIIDLTKEIAELKTKLSALGDLGHLKFLTLPSDKASLDNEKLESALEELKQIQVELRLAQNELESQKVLNNELTKSTEEYKSLLAKLDKNSKSQLGDIQSQLDGFKFKLASSESEVLEKQLQLEEQNAKYNELEASLEKIEDDYRVKETNLRTQVQDQANRLLANMVDLESTRAERDSLTNTNKTLQERTEKELDTIKSLQEQLSSLEKALSRTNEEMPELRKEIIELRQERNSLSESNLQIQTELEKCKDKLKQSDTQYADLIKDNANQVASQQAEIEKLALKLIDKQSTSVGSVSNTGETRTEGQEDIDDKYLNLLQSNRVAIKERTLLDKQLRECRSTIDSLETELTNLKAQYELTSVDNAVNPSTRPEQSEGNSAGNEVTESDKLQSLKLAADQSKPTELSNNVNLDVELVRSCRDYLQTFANSDSNETAETVRNLINTLDQSIQPPKEKKSIFGCSSNQKSVNAFVEIDESCVFISDPQIGLMDLQPKSPSIVSDHLDKTTLDDTASNEATSNSIKRLASNITPPEDIPGIKRIKQSATVESSVKPSSPAAAVDTNDVLTTQSDSQVVAATSINTTGKTRIQPIVWGEGKQTGSTNSLTESHTFDGSVTSHLTLRGTSRGIRRGAHYYRNIGRGGPRQR